SYPAVSPLPALRPAVCFLWHFPSSRLDRPLACTFALWSPDFASRSSGFPDSPAFTRTTPALPLYHARRRVHLTEHARLPGLGDVDGREGVAAQRHRLAIQR